MEDRYILHLEDVPEEFRDIARYLEKPLKDKQMREQLHAEQELEELLAIQEASMAGLSEELKEERRQNEEAQRQKEEALVRLARLLKSMGRTVHEIAAETGLPEEKPLYSPFSCSFPASWT